MSNQLGFIRKVLYSLKQNYGVRLEMYTRTDSRVNLETGEKVVDLRVFKIRKAILLPKQIARESVKLLGEERVFKYGGLFDQTKRVVLVDTRDYPADYTVRPNDYLIIAHKRYNIKEAQQFDHRLATLISVEETDAEEPAAVIDQSLQSNLEINSGGVAS